MLTYRKAKPITVTGIVTKSPQRVRTATRKAMATLTIQAESELRSSYPLTLVAYDDEAQTLMTSQKGNKITATGWPRWYNGYQLAGVQVISCLLKLVSFDLKSVNFKKYIIMH